MPLLQNFFFGKTQCHSPESSIKLFERIKYYLLNWNWIISRIFHLPSLWSIPSDENNNCWFFGLDAFWNKKEVSEKSWEELFRNQENIEIIYGIKWFEEVSSRDFNDRPSAKLINLIPVTRFYMNLHPLVHLSFLNEFSL